MLGRILGVRSLAIPCCFWRRTCHGRRRRCSLSIQGFTRLRTSNPRRLKLLQRKLAVELSPDSHKGANMLRVGQRQHAGRSRKPHEADTHLGEGAFHLHVRAPATRSIGCRRREIPNRGGYRSEPIQPRLARNDQGKLYLQAALKAGLPERVQAKYFSLPSPPTNCFNSAANYLDGHFCPALGFHSPMASLRTVRPRGQLGVTIPGLHRMQENVREPR